MKTIFLYFCCMLGLTVTAQTTINRSYPVTAGQKVALTFDYPKIVRVSTWDKNEVLVTAHVSINDGEDDTAFVLNDQTENGVLTISNQIKNMKNLPKRYTVIENGKKTVFRSRDDYQAFTRTMGNNHRITSSGVDMEITVEVKMPANIAADIKATYGMVELVDFRTPATVNATYGGIDATVSPANTGKLQVTTHYGQIYSNLDLKITDKTEKDFFTSLTAEPGKGPAYILKSTYGNLYLRKQ